MRLKPFSNLTPSLCVGLFSISLQLIGVHVLVLTRLSSWWFKTFLLFSFFLLLICNDFLVSGLLYQLFEAALIRISSFFEAIFIPLGFSFRNCCKYPSVIWTCCYSKFRKKPFSYLKFSKNPDFHSLKIQEINKNSRFIYLKKPYLQ